jgi:stage II sporulation protein D
MDPQAFDRNRRLFLLASAVAAAGSLLSCDQPKGMTRPRGQQGSAPGNGGTATNAAGAAGGAKASDGTGDASKSGSDPTKPADATSGKAKLPPPTERPAPPSSEPAIRIKTGGLPKGDPRVQIEGPGPAVWIIEPGSGKPGTVAEGPVDFAWTAAGWKVTERFGTREARPVAVPARATLEVMALGGEPSQLKVFGSVWPGKVRLVLQPDDPNEPVDVVHEVPMETYLSGVIAKELFNNWGAATHRAQAIAARSYAVCEMAMWKGRRHFDVVAGEQSQAWIGTTAHKRSLDAVAATRGQVLVWESRVVPAYYSSCCGGARAAARDAISSAILHDIPPLGVARGDAGDCCSWAPTYRWNSRMDLATFARTLPAWARAEGYASLFKVDGVRRVEILEKNPAGRPVRYALTDAKGQRFEVTAERLRWALNADPRNPANLRPAKERIKSAYFEPLVAGGELVLSGRGHGHGVGMCQYGAEAMSKKGAKEAAILSRYYPGASVAKSYA